MQETATRLPRTDAPPRSPRLHLCKAVFFNLRRFARSLLTTLLGVPPEAVEMAKLMAASPELSAAIRDPAVHQLLRDARTRKELAELLTTAARHALYAAAPLSN